MVIFDQGIYSAVAFVASVAVARSAGAAELAVWALSQTILTSGLIVSRCIVGTPFTVLSAAMEPKLRDRYLTVCLLLQTFLCVISGAVLAVASALIDDRGLHLALLALAVAGPMILLRDLLRSSFLAALQVRSAFVMSVWTNAIAFALIIIAAFQFRATAALALLGLGIGAAAGVVAYGWPRLGCASREALGTHLRENWRFGRHTLLANVLSMIVLQTVPWFVLATGDKSAVAELAAALGITGLIRPVTQGLSSYLTPVLSRHYVNGGREQAIRTGMFAVRLMAVCGGVFVAAMWLGGTFVVQKLYGVSVSAVLVLVPVAVSAALESIGVILRANARAMHRPSEETVAAAISACFGTVSAVALIPMFHAAGAAASLVVSQFVFVLTCMVRLRRSRSQSTVAL